MEQNLFGKSLLMLVLVLLGAYAPLARGQLTNRTIIHSFGAPSQSGYYPAGRLIEGSDGMLYGVTEDGGGNYSGVVFRAKRDGSLFQTLHHFGVAEQDGERPMAGLVEASDGALYGTTIWGGAAGGGTIFRINKDGSDYTTLHGFRQGDQLNGGTLDTELVEGSDGALYGTILNGGTNRLGAIYKMRKDGSGFGLVLSFLGGPSHGAAPTGGLIARTNDLLYGICATGGLQNGGIVFRVGLMGDRFTVLHDFTTTEGMFPLTLTDAKNGWFLGTTKVGGATNAGTIFKLRYDGTGFQVIHHFGRSNTVWTTSAIAADADHDVLYGTTFQEGDERGNIYKVGLDGAGFSLLRTFVGGPADGRNPESILAGSDGRIYGTTFYGGSNIYNFGTIFRLMPDGSDYRTLWHFQDLHGGDGTYPKGLTEGSDGSLYITTIAGGAANSGALTKSSKDGRSYRVLHPFWTGANDAFWYAEELMEASDGWLYGTTYWGEHGEEPRLYRIGRDGQNYSVLQLFIIDYTAEHSAGVTEGSDGFLYGTTGGSTYSGGTLYRFNRHSGQFTVLRAFGLDFNETMGPNSILVEASDGRLYGSTAGAWPDYQGAIFGVNKDGSGYSELHRFGTASNDGVWANTLIEGSDGKLYGTTYSGGVANLGTIFRVSKDGSSYAVLHQFTGSPQDGATPDSGVIEGKDGALYGTTVWGGEGGQGTFFKVQKDGNNFRVLNHGGKLSKMIQGRDHAFYSLASGTGEVAVGALYRMGHALSLEKTGSGVQLRLTGIPGYTYQLQRSANLADWTTIRTDVMPEIPLLQHQEGTAGGAAAFYRMVAP